ncbi:MAG: amidase domain-containing protein [Ruminiclostridium sp.]|nr:amidase domain-containing protein [Ruminiclostridium sp.]
MDHKFKTVLTAMIVVVLTAIYVVGIFLFWDVFNVESTLDELINKDLYGTEQKPNSSTQVEISVSGKLISEEEELLLKDFFTYYYAGLGALKAERISRFYESQVVSELFDESALDYEIWLAKQCPVDLSFEECTLTLEIERRHEAARSQKIEIDLELTAESGYVTTGRHAVTRGERHYFILDRENKSLLIEEHTTERPSRVFFETGLDKVLEANRLTQSDLAYTFFPKYTAPTLEMLKAEMTGITFTAADKTAYPKPEYKYDRDTAANTAIGGFSGNGAFTEYEENDANFVSRCIFEGNIPMDAQGEKNDQWKWYDEEVNTERKKTGCSKSWFDREAFYTYVLANTGFGLVGCETTSGGGEIGDVLQLLTDGKAVSEYMITGVMTDSSGKVRDYLISNDRRSSVSLLSLGCAEFRILHIAGYNTANI